LPIRGVHERNLCKRGLCLEELIYSLLIGDFLNAEDVWVKSLQLGVKPSPFTRIVLWIASHVPRHDQELAWIRRTRLRQLTTSGTHKEGDNHQEGGKE
jgi:hypothetical protein